MTVSNRIEDLAGRLGKTVDAVRAYAQVLADMDGPESVYTDESECHLTAAAAGAITLAFSIQAPPFHGMDEKVVDLLDRISVAEDDRYDRAQEAASATNQRDNLIRQALRRDVPAADIASAALVGRQRIYQIRDETPKSAEALSVTADERRRRHTSPHRTVS